MASASHSSVYAPQKFFFCIITIQVASKSSSSQIQNSPLRETRFCHGLLDKYIDLGPIDSAREVDVHGKQGKLLMKSRCYQISSDLNCSTCHDVHQKEPGLEVMSRHCLACHKVEQSPTHVRIGEAITKNCVDCHMPRLESKVVYINVDGQKVRPKFRSHWIRIYSQNELQ